VKETEGTNGRWIDKFSPATITFRSAAFVSDENNLLGRQSRQLPGKHADLVLLHEGGPVLVFYQVDVGKHVDFLLNSLE
jgi:hypothetical protein